MLQKIGAFLLIFLVVCSCGRRGLPPSPDRWAPKLAGAKPLDKNHVDIIFSEKMDAASAESKSSYLVLGKDNDTLGVYSAELLSSGQRARLTTETQEDVTYTVYVDEVKDAAGNAVRGESRKSFRGSTVPDTARPVVKEIFPRDGSFGIPADTALRVVFSETMDTSSTSIRAGSIVILPPPSDLSTRWNASMTVLSIPIISLSSHVSYVCATSGCRDYSGNPLLRLEKSVFAMLDSMPAGKVSGTVTAPDGVDPSESTVGIFDSLKTPLMLDLVRDSTGEYSFFHLPDGAYSISAALDEDDDGTFDYRGSSGEIDLDEDLQSEGVRVELSRDAVLEDNIEGVLGNFHRMNLLEEIGQ